MLFNKKTRSKAGLISCRRNNLRFEAYMTSSDKIKLNVANMLNFVHIITKARCILKRRVCFLFFSVADVDKPLQKRFPVTGPCSDVQIRDSLQYRFIGCSRRHPRKSISAAALAGFEHRRAALACGFAVEHLTFAAATASGQQLTFTVTCRAFALDQFVLDFRRYDFHSVRVEDSRMFDHILILRG